MKERLLGRVFFVDLLVLCVKGENSVGLKKKVGMYAFSGVLLDLVKSY